MKLIQMIKKIKIMTLNNIKVIIIVTRDCKKNGQKIQKIKRKNKQQKIIKKVNFIEKVREKFLKNLRKVAMKIIKNFDYYEENNNYNF